MTVRLVKSEASGRSQYEISVDDRPSLRFRSFPHRNEPPVEQLCWLGKDWLVAYYDHVILNGEDINRTLGAQSVFYYRRVAGQSLYFFRRDGGVGLSFGGEVQSPRYERVLYHPPQDLVRYDIRSNDERVWFYAYRGHRWYFVDASVSKK